MALVVARAVVRNDRSMLLGAVGPKGLRIGKRSYTAASLEAALAAKSVLELVAPIFVELWGQPDDSVGYFTWNAEGSENGAPKIWFSSGYGKQPYFTLKKTGEAWHVAEFGVQDLGEP